MLSWLSGASVRIDSITRMLGPGGAQERLGSRHSAESSRPPTEAGTGTPEQRPFEGRYAGTDLISGTLHPKP